MRVNANGLIVNGSQILLARFEDANGVYYTIPGGKIERGESVTEALKRECWEEGGVEVEIGELCLTYDYHPDPLHRGRFGKKRKLGLLFRAKLLSPPESARMIQPDSEQTGIEWVSFERLESSAAAGRPLLYPAIEGIVVRLAREPLAPAQFFSNFTSVAAQ